MNTSAILYEIPQPHIARIVLNRPEVHNAQDTNLLYALNDAFDRAAGDPDIKVIILAANGKNFSAGHDLSEEDYATEFEKHSTVGTWCGWGCGAADATLVREHELYLDLSERWRNLPKPTIASVQGKCISGGLMLIWPCDLIVASEDAQFRDNTMELGVCGVEYFTHPYELGMRKAKEMLFTADWINAQEAYRLGMVNRIVPRDQLEEATMTLALRIAQKSLFALRLAKSAANGIADATGRVTAMHNAFHLHQLAHSHNMQEFGLPLDPALMDRAILNKYTDTVRFGDRK